MIDLSRRTFLAAAGSAATMPAVALAAPGETQVLPLDARYRTCLDELRKVIAEMHPHCTVPEAVDTVSDRGERTITLAALKPSVPSA